MSFEPPPYPQDRLGDLRSVAGASSPDGVLDLSVGNPGDPLPDFVATALTAALDRSERYPASVGFPELREAAAGWLHRRLGVETDAEQVLACVGTKELVAGLPRALSLRHPDRDTVLYPAVSYPTYEMGAQLAGLRAVPVPMDHEWRPDLEGVDDETAGRSLLLWLNEPGNPTGSTVDERWYAETVAWARERGVIVASDECYVEFVFDGAPASALSAGPAGVLSLHSLSKRSNMAGLRCGFAVGDEDLVTYLGEVRKHAGFMVPGPVQLAGAAALADDAHVDEQRERYRERREAFLVALEGTGLVHDGGAGTFYLWLRDDRGGDGWKLAGEFAEVGILVAPGDLYGPGGRDHVRVALVESLDRLRPALQRLRDARGAG